MKKIYKNLTRAALGVLLGTALILPAHAQHRVNPNDGGNSGNGNNNNSGGSSAPRQSATQNVAPPQRNDNPPQRSNNNANIAPQQHNNGNYNPQQRSTQGNTNYTPRQRDNNNNNNGQFQRNNPDNSNYSPRQRGNNGSVDQSQTRSNTMGIAPQQRGSAVGQQRGSNYNQGSQRPGFNPAQRDPGFNSRRSGVTLNTGYRSYPRQEYGRNRITVRPRGLYYNNRSYYRSYYTPRLGFRINVLPGGYYPFYYGPNQYFYSEGLYYQYDNNEYTVVEPPIGAEITTLPDKAQAIQINGIQYYELNGVYYQPITKDDGTVVYQIAGKDGELNTDNGSSAQDVMPQIGDLVNDLPDGTKTLKLNGQKYYVTSDGYYFQDATDVNGDKVYKIVGTPTDEPGN